MTSVIPATEPSEVTAGNLVQWTREDLTDCYPASVYDLKYYFVKSGSQIIITATADGETFSISVPTATTAVWSPGTYTWDAYASKTGERFTVDSGTMEILPDFETQTGGFDARSNAKIILDAIDAVLQGRATKDQESYSIEGISLSRTPIADLLLLRDKFKQISDREQQAEDISNGLSPRNRVKVRFQRP